MFKKYDLCRSYDISSWMICLMVGAGCDAHICHVWVFIGEKVGILAERWHVRPWGHSDVASRHVSQPIVCVSVSVSRRWHRHNGNTCPYKALDTVQVEIVRKHLIVYIEYWLWKLARIWKTNHSCRFDLKLVNYNFWCDHKETAFSA